MPDERWGELVTALIVPRAGQHAEQRMSWSSSPRSRLAGYKLPRSVELVDELPRTPTGKVLKRELRDRRAQRAISLYTHPG